MFIRGYEKRICVFLLILIFISSFSMISFSDAYTGAYLDYEEDPVTGVVSPVLKDVNPTGETFSGSNVIEMNVYNNAPELEANTFNGSTEINNTFQNLDSTGNNYNGSVDIDLTGTGTMTSTVDTFQNASVNASMSDVTFDSPTFNGTTTLQANSLTLGSVPQMDDLIANILLFREFFTTQLTSSNTDGAAPAVTISSSYGNSTVTGDLPQYLVQRITFSNGSLSVQYIRYRMGFFRIFDYEFQFLTINFQAIAQYLSYQIWGNGYTYNLYNYTSSGETYNLTITSTTNSFRECMANRLEIIIRMLHYFFSHFYEWYYPLDNVLPEYWRYYNTDTGQQEEIGLAGLMYNISWYLGQMYVLQSGSDALDNMTDQVEAITDTLEEAEQKENAVISSISSAINNFAPDLTEVGAFKALSWTSNYLQQVFLALGTYGTVILVGLLLGVCMQFIGYFKYK